MRTKLMHEVKNTVKYWWVSLLIGILSVIVGVWCLFIPTTALLALSYLFIVGFLVSGILEIIFALSNSRNMDGWGWSLTGGIIDLLFGFLLLVMPLPIITIALVYFVGFWLMFRSIWTIGSSIELQKQGIRGWGWSLALGIVSVLFSLAVIVSPMFGGAFVVAFTAVTFLVYGISRIFQAFRLQSVYKDIKSFEGDGRDG